MNGRMAERLLSVMLIVAALSPITWACAEGAGSKVPTRATGDSLEPSRIREVTARVADWQLEHPKGEPIEWTNAVFYSGLMAAYRVTGDPRYVAVLVEIGDRANWRIGERIRHADDHAIAQTYLELFRLEPQPRRQVGFQNAIDRMMAEPPDWAKPHQEIDYWWCDALFMSPPALAKLAAITGDGSYLVFMDRLWGESFELLFDREQRLFHRDLRFRDQSGSFWARGNAWVLAGLARLIEELPAEHPSRAFYEDVFRDLAARILELQGEDGLWRSDLLASELSAPGESSASALFCFALAWGVDHGLLAREVFSPSVAAAWTALLGNVNEAGRLGGVQKPGAQPGRSSERHSEAYASGAFLLAAEQVLALELDSDS